MRSNHPRWALCRVLPPVAEMEGDFRSMTYLQCCALLLLWPIITNKWSKVSHCAFSLRPTVSPPSETRHHMLAFTAEKQQHNSSKNQLSKCVHCIASTKRNTISASFSASERQLDEDRCKLVLDPFLNDNNFLPAHLLRTHVGSPFIVRSISQTATRRMCYQENHQIAHVLSLLQHRPTEP